MSEHTAQLVRSLASVTRRLVLVGARAAAAAISAELDQIAVEATRRQ